MNRANIRSASSRQSISSPHNRGNPRRKMNDIIYSTARARPVPAGVYPASPLSQTRFTGSPRTCGGIPVSAALQGPTRLLAPYLRGYTRPIRRCIEPLRVHPVPTGAFPSPSRRPMPAGCCPHARGVFRNGSAARSSTSCCPRVRGGIPEVGLEFAESEPLAPYLRGIPLMTLQCLLLLSFSPYARGYSVYAPEPSKASIAVPVCAGVFLSDRLCAV